MKKPIYQRVVIKLSGEALGLNKQLFDFDKFSHTGRVLKGIADMGVQLCVVIGAGNLCRGRAASEAGVDGVTADQMGMLGTMMNCLAMRDAIERAGGQAEVLSAFHVPRMLEPFSARRAEELLARGVIVLSAGGTGNPFFTTDTAVVLRAIELKADALLMGKNIDGVYDDVPSKPGAKLLRELTYQEAARRGLKVCDGAAFAQLVDHPVGVMRVFALEDPESIVKVLMGDDMGTTLHA